MTTDLHDGKKWCGSDGLPAIQADPSVLQTNQTKSDLRAPLYHLLARTSESRAGTSFFFYFASRSIRVSAPFLTDW